MNTSNCDVLVIGSGAGGLSAAVTARQADLDVIVAEKAPVFGGTTAFSGGVLWIPGNRHARAQGIVDSQDAAREYLRRETGAWFNEAASELFLDHAAEMVDWFERETSVKFVPTLYPDYHPDVPGGADVGRSILAAPFDIRGLGADMARLRPPLKTITFIGMMFNSSNADLKHFFRATKSLTSFFYVCRRLATHLKELAIYRRGVQVTSGNALAARLAKSALDLGVPIWTDSPARRLIVEDGRVVGAVLQRDGVDQVVRARHGVVLACGGFPHDRERIAQAYPHLRRGGEHLSPVPVDNTGDGIRLAETVGAKLEIRFPSTSAWMPVSKVPYADGSHGVFPHLLDRYKPGIIGVTRDGRRFCNESESYHDVGAAMIKACEGQAETAMWLVCDQQALSRYGLGHVKPAPMPLAGPIQRGYLLRGRTLEELAAQAGIDAAGLVRTVAEYNEGAREGVDRQFGRGTTRFNRYLADPENQPNPCVAPIGQGPYYAVKVIMGDLGTFDGLDTTPQGEVLDAEHHVIPGLYAVGNDRASMMGGNYPAAGITLGPNMTFGWLTARLIVQRACESNPDPAHPADAAQAQSSSQPAATPAQEAAHA
ncbi:FAD-dependent oxidoreductase [Leptothrix discophora]|uniref:FAD-dependent oxidoreductase n=1 Tax=Leptothrix discophora TaxID=89 RepID=A0ABT9FY80_LEPDI|nr:FAD-dependent oxidoreductase [Leptothrix discophora]MDP4299179.1 FAD-dependent oxidoreductase [Leptothrix discophora]